MLKRPVLVPTALRGLRASRGFSLIELLVTVLVAGILLTAAVPSYSFLIDRSRMSTAAGELHKALFFARSEAVKRGENVIVESVTGGIDWHGGWRMYQDTDRNGVQDPGEGTLWVSGPLKGPYTIAASLPSIRYTPSASLSVSPTIVTFTVCSNGKLGETGRTVAIAQTGRATVTDFLCT